MKKSLIIAAAASLLAAGPAMAEETARASAPVTQSSQIEGTAILGVAAFAAFLTAVILISDDDDDDVPVSA